MVNNMLLARRRLSKVSFINRRDWERSVRLLEQGYRERALSTTLIKGTSGLGIGVCDISQLPIGQPSCLGGEANTLWGLSLGGAPT